jgi:hypothetical protein
MPSSPVPQSTTTIYAKLNAAGVSSAEAEDAVTTLKLPVLGSRIEHVAAAVRWVYALRAKERALRAAGAYAACAGDNAAPASDLAATSFSGASATVPRAALPERTMPPPPPPPQHQLLPELQPRALPQQRASTRGELTTQLRELSELHAAGALTAEEFTAAKANVLGVRMPASG